VVGATFVEAHPSKNKGFFLWYPVAVAEFGNCPNKKVSGRFVIDCYAYSLIGSSLVRFLMLKKLRKEAQLLPYPSIDAPILQHNECSEYSFMKNAEELWHVLQNEEKAVDMIKQLSTAATAKAEEQVRERRFRFFLFRGPRVNIERYALRSNVAILKEILSNLCLDKYVKPSSWTPSHILLRIDTETSSVSILVGKNEEYSTTYSRFLFRDEIYTTIKSKLNLT